MRVCVAIMQNISFYASTLHSIGNDNLSDSHHAKQNKDKEYEGQLSKQVYNVHMVCVYSEL